MELKEAGEDMPALREVARGLIKRAKENNSDCMALADRLDGKVPQALVGSDEDPPVNVVTRIELVAPSLNGDSET